MAETITQQILRNSLDLSYADIRQLHPSWDDRAVSDYFYKQGNINTLALSGEGVEAQVILNTAQIALNVEAIELNADNLTGHIDDTVGAHAASAISYDGTLSGLAATNDQDAIDEVVSDLDTHEALETAHGVTGDNVGTEDFASSLVGGVVLLAANVDDAVASTVSVTSPDATAAPVVYDQTDAQTAVTLVNELKADLTQVITDFNAVTAQLNAFLAANQTAKQMSP